MQVAGRGRRNFIRAATPIRRSRNSYTIPMPVAASPARFPTLAPPSIRAKESSMLDVLFYGGGLVLFCLLIAYERLCNRI